MPILNAISKHKIDASEGDFVEVSGKLSARDEFENAVSFPLNVNGVLHVTVHCDIETTAGTVTAPYSQRSI